MSRVLVTGGNGFVGRALCPALMKAGHHVRISTRTKNSTPDANNIEIVTTGEIDSKTDWTKAVENIDVIVHLAGRAHVMRETASDPMLAFHQVNVEGTQKLAETAIQHGVKRFVFMSSIKVLGERTNNKPFQETDTPAPEDAYGRSKWEAEQILLDITQNTPLETVILRPPLIYGPQVKGNFHTLLKICSKKIPLPFGMVKNQRSMIFADNLCSAILQCIEHDKAAGEIFLVRDDEDVSTAMLIQHISHALDSPALLIPIPPMLLRLAGYLTGRRAMVQRLTDSLVVDDRHIRTLLGWKPPHSMVEGLEKTAAWYQSTQSVDLNKHH